MRNFFLIILAFLLLALAVALTGCPNEPGSGFGSSDDDDSALADDDDSTNEITGEVTIGFVGDSVSDSPVQLGDMASFGAYFVATERDDVTEVGVDSPDIQLQQSTDNGLTWEGAHNAQNYFVMCSVWETQSENLFWAGTSPDQNGVIAFDGRATTPDELSVSDGMMFHVSCMTLAVNDEGTCFAMRWRGQNVTFDLDGEVAVPQVLSNNGNKKVPKAFFCF